MNYRTVQAWSAEGLEHMGLDYNLSLQVLAQACCVRIFRAELVRVVVVVAACPERPPNFRAGVAFLCAVC